MFRLKTASGEQFFAKRVVLATGLSLFQHLPSEFRRLPAGRVTHPSQHRSFSEFAGREVTVLGRGASALNAAVLLHEAGARVTLLSRSRRIHTRPATRGTAPPPQHGKRPATLLGNSLRSKLACATPGAVSLLPAPLRRALFFRHLRPAGDPALAGRLTGFTVLPGCKVHAVEAADGSGGRLRLTLTDAEGNVRQHLTSHLIAGTGYRIDLERLTMLCPSLRECIRVDREGAPKLNRALESSVPGLHFIGAAAAPTFGPMLRFVAGTGFAAERVTAEIARSLVRERRASERASSVGVLAGPARERAL